MQRLAVLLATLALAACSEAGVEQAAVAQCQPASPRPDPTQPTQGMVRLDGGAMLMGARPLRPEEGPPHRVEVAPFWIDATDVTNAQFTAFVAATDYVTMAERGPEPSSLVFSPPDEMPTVNDVSLWWRIVPRADWRHPYGPDSSLAGRAALPVVHVAYEDALAYAHWLGRDLPTEAEWEFAARGGIDGATYAWGDTPSEPTSSRANTWQGPFPVADSGDDGFAMQPSPVGCFAPNGYGLYDMAGNVWQWTKDIYVAGGDDDAPDVAAYDPADPAAPQRVIKGGSFLCADSFCLRYRPAARQGAAIGGGTSHIGFRTVYRGLDDNKTAALAGEETP